ncbi:oncoprotein-induced transcript 3 protein-like [Ostrea edulis]|uniref:oncoprotein-induced transcript 3 protein-like n=1 Tax=Ostrea edulis TaxID=37623 RepID=UPI0024AF08AD|nr:oncoprotein-induced transcript 3 protein-like [Ostrea edulis]
MAWLESLFGFILSILIHSTDTTYYCSTSPDPCTSSDTLFESYARTQNCPHDSQYSPCDRYITPGWYRANDSILDQCPNLNSCGAIYPVWLNDSLPNVGDPIVTKTLCKTGFSDCCVGQYDIQIKNCGTFYSYCLPALDGCPERVCFGTNGSCEYPTTANVQTTQINTEQGQESKDLETKYIVLISVSVTIFICGVYMVFLKAAFYFLKMKNVKQRICADVTDQNENQKIAADTFPGDPSQNVINKPNTLQNTDCNKTTPDVQFEHS